MGKYIHINHMITDIVSRFEGAISDADGSSVLITGDQICLIQ